jgi:predicted HTH domain antitoxin
MNVTLSKIPKRDHETIHLQWQQLSQETVETMIAELYRNDAITFQEAGELLHSHSWQETSAILEKHGCTLYYDRDDFDHDLDIVKKYIDAEST